MIVEMLISTCVKHRLEVVARAFNAVGGYYVSSHQVALVVRYATALLSLAVSRCYVLGYEIQSKSSGLVDVVLAPPFGESRFP